MLKTWLILSSRRSGRGSAGNSCVSKVPPNLHLFQVSLSCALRRKAVARYGSSCEVSFATFYEHWSATVLTRTRTTFTARFRPTLKSEHSGRNCFFSPIQCQLPVLPGHTMRQSPTPANYDSASSEQQRSSPMASTRRRFRRRNSSNIEAFNAESFELEAWNVIELWLSSAYIRLRHEAGPHFVSCPYAVY